MVEKETIDHFNEGKACFEALVLKSVKIYILLIWIKVFKI